MATASLTVAHGQLGVGTMSMHAGNTGASLSKPVIPKKPTASTIGRTQSHATPHGQQGELMMSQPNAPPNRPAMAQQMPQITRLPATKPNQNQFFDQPQSHVQQQSQAPSQLQSHRGAPQTNGAAAVATNAGNQHGLNVNVAGVRSSSRSMNSNAQNANTTAIATAGSQSSTSNANTGSSRQLSSASVSAAASTQEEKDLNVGRYRIMRTIGKGNFARVKLARHVLTGCEVAIKIMDKSQMNQSTLQKVYREIRIMKTIDHPNITKLYEVIETPRNLYLVLEYSPNGELFDYLVTHGRMKEKDAREKFRQIISAVQYLHGRRIVHRDLKDENLLLDDNFNIKLCDFGFANEFHADRKLDTFCGSPPYAAPELYQGRKYDGPEVDTWSLGVILYTLVSGSLPFDGQNLRELREKVIHGKYRIPFYMSTDCETLLKKMLQLVPQRRPTLESLMATDRWLNFGYEDNPLRPFVPASDDFADEERIDQLVRYGFTRAEIADSLNKRKYDHICAVYIMLRTRREREISSSAASASASTGTSTRRESVAGNASNASTKMTTAAPSNTGTVGRDRNAPSQAAPQATPAAPAQTGFIPARGAVSAIASIRAPIRNRAPLTLSNKNNNGNNNTNADAATGTGRRNMYENVVSRQTPNDDDEYYRDDEIDRLAAELDSDTIERPPEPPRSETMGIRRQPTYHVGDRRTQQMLMESHQLAALDRTGKLQNVQNLHELTGHKPQSQPQAAAEVLPNTERKRSVGANALPLSATQPNFNVEPPHTYANVALTQTVSSSGNNWQTGNVTTVSQPSDPPVQSAQSASLARSAKTRDSPRPLAAPTHTITEFVDDDGTLDRAPPGQFIRQANVRRTCPTNPGAAVPSVQPSADATRSRSVRSKPKLSLTASASNPSEAPQGVDIDDSVWNVQNPLQPAIVRSASLRRSNRRGIELPPPPPPPPVVAPVPTGSSANSDAVFVVKTPLRASQRGATPETPTTPTTPTTPFQNAPFTQMHVLQQQQQRVDQPYEPVNVASGAMSMASSASAPSRASFRQSQPLALANPQQSYIQPPSWQQGQTTQAQPQTSTDPGFVQTYNGYPQAYPHPYTNPYAPAGYQLFAGQNQQPPDPSYSDVTMPLQRNAGRNSFVPSAEYTPQFPNYIQSAAPPQTPIYSRPQRPSNAGTLQSNMSTTGRRLPPPPPPAGGNANGNGGASVTRSQTHTGSSRPLDSESQSHVRPSRSRSKSNVFGRLARFFRRSSRRRDREAHDDRSSRSSGSGPPSPTPSTTRSGVEQSAPASPSRRPHRATSRRNETANDESEGKSDAGFAQSDPALLDHSSTLSRKPRSLRFTFRFRFASPLNADRLLERVEAALDNAHCLYRRTRSEKADESQNPYALHCEYIDVQNPDMNCKWTMEIVHLPRLGLNGVRCKRLEGHEARYRGLVNRLLGDLSVSS